MALSVIGQPSPELFQLKVPVPGGATVYVDIPEGEIWDIEYIYVWGSSQFHVNLDGHWQTMTGTTNWPGKILSVGQGRTIRCFNTHATTEYSVVIAGEKRS